LRLLSKKKPEKSLTVRIKRTGGRAAMVDTSCRREAEPEKLYRIIEFGQAKLDMPAEVMAIEYDPNRNAFIALIQYEDKEKKYIIAP
jgi:large subunit ribosomal protein L2